MVGDDRPIVAHRSDLRPFVQASIQEDPNDIGPGKLRGPGALGVELVDPLIEGLDELGGHANEELVILALRGALSVRRHGPLEDIYLARRVKNRIHEDILYLYFDSMKIS